jgi:hypothetical protein
MPDGNLGIRECLNIDYNQSNAITARKMAIRPLNATTFKYAESVPRLDTIAAATYNEPQILHRITCHGKSRLEKLMIVDKPIVPPDSVIKTFSGLKGDHVDFEIT